jgi:hypothetical protein
MAKAVHDDVLDGALKVIKSNANLITVCTTQPTTRSQAIKKIASSGYKLASIATSASDYTIAAGASSNGRKVTVGAQNSVSVDSNGSAQHVAIVDGTRLLLVTTCTKQALTAGNKVNIPAFTDTISDPT